MNAVIRRVLGLNHEPLEQEFPAGARAAPAQGPIREPIDYLPEPWRHGSPARSWTDPAPAAAVLATPAST